MSTLSVVLRPQILEALRGKLGSDDGIAYARKRIAEQIGEMLRKADSEIGMLRQRLSRTEERIANLVAHIADGGERSDAILSGLRDFEAEAKDVKLAIAGLQSQASAPIRLPSPDEVTRLVFDLDARLTQDVLRGREELRQLFRGGKIQLEAQADGAYIARAEILPLVLLMPKSRTPTLEFIEGRRHGSVGCGGRI